MQQRESASDEAERSVLDHGHAVFAISAYLRALSLHEWTERFLSWIGRYDGLERYIEPAEEPFLAVRALLLRFVVEVRDWLSHGPLEAAVRALKERIVDELLQLDFVRYHAFWDSDPVPSGAARVWQPMQDGWLDFMEQRRAGDVLWIWQRAQPNPSGEALRSYLLAAS